LRCRARGFAHSKSKQSVAATHTSSIPWLRLPFVQESMQTLTVTWKKWGTLPLWPQACQHIPTHPLWQWRHNLQEQLRLQWAVGEEVGMVRPAESQPRFGKALQKRSRSCVCCCVSWRLLPSFALRHVPSPVVSMTDINFPPTQHALVTCSSVLNWR
jgi:hypothetical protein